MATSTILRVKRRLEDNPQDALVLMCKRMKKDNEEISPSLFVFRGTVENEEASHVKNIVPKPNVGIKSVSNVKDIIQKIRKERKENSEESRYEVVNCSRGLKESNGEDGTDIFDLVDLRQKNEPDAADMDIQYAYDLYVATRDFDISMIDNLVSIENYETDLVFGSYRDNGRQTPSSDGADDDDDSNDENNWRNDYPDSEPSSIDEEDMVRAMERVDIEDDLSSDTGEDKIYDDPPDLSSEDVKRYGEAYAKYKARVMSENPDLRPNLIHSVTVKDMDEEVDGYKNDSDDGFYYGQDEDSEQFREQYQSDLSDEYSPD